jgi:hypothetical protein
MSVYICVHIYIYIYIYMFVIVYVFVVRVEHENLKQKTGQQFKIRIPIDRWWIVKIKIKHTETHYIEDDGLYTRVERSRWNNKIWNWNTANAGRTEFSIE